MNKTTKDIECEMIMDFFSEQIKCFNVFYKKEYYTKVNKEDKLYLEENLPNHIGSNEVNEGEYIFLTLYGDPINIEDLKKLLLDEEYDDFGIDLKSKSSIKTLLKDIKSNNDDYLNLYDLNNIAISIMLNKLNLKPK